MIIIEQRILESINIKQRILEDKNIIEKIQILVDRILECYKNGGKVILCGNGGSATDAMHIAGELVGRFQVERRPLPAMVLNADIASLTAISNDYGYDNVFYRPVKAFMQPIDVLIGISTSGNSKNVYSAIISANSVGGYSFGLLGKDGGTIKNVASDCIIIPSDVTARIQECHILIGHIVCEVVENVFKESV